jgi:hypothetical protein
MTYGVRATTLGDGVSVAYAKEATIRFDSSLEQGPLLPGPADLLAAAFAACILKNVERMSALLPFRYHDAGRGHRRASRSTTQDDQDQLCAANRYRRTDTSGRAAAPEHPRVRHDLQRARGGLRGTRRDNDGRVAHPDRLSGGGRLTAKVTAKELRVGGSRRTPANVLSKAWRVRMSTAIGEQCRLGLGNRCSIP